MGRLLGQLRLKVVSREYPRPPRRVPTINVYPGRDGLAVVHEDIHYVPFEFVRWRVAGSTSFILIQDRQSWEWLIQETDLSDDPPIRVCADFHSRMTVQLEQCPASAARTRETRCGGQKSRPLRTGGTAE